MIRFWFSCFVMIIFPSFYFFEIEAISKVSQPRAGSLVSWEMKIHWEVSRPRTGPVWNVEKSLQLEKKILKNIFSFRFMSVKAFLMESIDTLLHLTSKSQQKKLVFRLLWLLFSSGSANFKMIANHFHCRKQGSSGMLHVEKLIHYDLIWTESTTRCLLAFLNTM